MYGNIILLWEQEVAGSNPATSTFYLKKPLLLRLFCFVYFSMKSFKKIFFLLLVFNFSQACIEGEEIELWGECFNIENTIYLNFNNYAGQNEPLTGEIPPSIGALVNLEYFDVTNNELTGEIPIELINLPNLRTINLSSNQFSGELPVEFWNLSNLNIAYLGGNQFSGQIPSTIENLYNLSYLDLSHNELTGELPSEIGNLSNVNGLYLSNNNFYGEIPSEISNLGSNMGYISWLDLSYNEFSGTIPDEFCYNIYYYSGTFIPHNVGYNKLCPPYPDCITQEDIDSQDISDCQECLMGDFNEDLTINILDVVAAVNYILNGQNLDCGDLNDDGILNIIDIIQLVNIILNN